MTNTQHRTHTHILSVTAGIHTYLFTYNHMHFIYETFNALPQNEMMNEKQFAIKKIAFKKSTVILHFGSEDIQVVILLVLFCG